LVSNKRYHIFHIPSISDSIRIRTVHRCYLVVDPLQDAADRIARYRHFWKERFDALADAAVIEKWSGTLAKMDDQVGTRFSLFVGNVTGTHSEDVGVALVSLLGGSGIGESGLRESGLRTQGIRPGRDIPGPDSRFPDS
jgi:hypothetical protein